MIVLADYMMNCVTVMLSHMQLILVKFAWFSFLKDVASKIEIFLLQKRLVLNSSYIFKLCLGGLSDPKKITAMQRVVFPAESVL